MDYSEKIARYEEIERRGLLSQLPQEKQEAWAEYKRRQAPQQTPQEESSALGKIATIDKGATFGLGRKLGGLVNAIGAAPVDAIMGKNIGQAFWDRYHEITDEAQEAQREYAKNNPTKALALELGSAILNPVNKVGVGVIGKGANFGSKLARSVGVGGGVGATAGALDTENADQFVKNTATGAAGGAAVGAALPLAALGLKGLGNAARQVLGKTTGAGDVAIADAFNAGKAGNKTFLEKMKGAIDQEGLEKKVQGNFDKIRKARNMSYADDIERLKLETADKKLDLKPVIDDVRSILKQEGGGADYLVDSDTKRVLDVTKDTLNKFYKDKSRHNLEGFDNLKKALQNIKTQEGTNAERVKTQISNSVKGQILKQSPKYQAIENNYAKDSEILNDLKKVFSLNRNANSETVLKKLQSTARNNANTDWTYRAQLLNKLDPTGEIREEISANALNTWAPRGGLGGIVGFGGLFSRNIPLILSSSPRAVGYGAYGLGRAVAKTPSVNVTPYIAELLSQNLTKE